MNDLSTMAIVPAYNEEGRIGDLLTRLIPVVDHICVIDDGSSDNTYNEASVHNVHIIRHEKNRGKGGAIKTGIGYFLSQNYNILVFIDADGQHSPEDIPRFIYKFKTNPDLDVLVATRFGTDEWVNNMPFMRKISNLLSRFGIWILYNGLIIEDPQNGFRAYKRKVIENIFFKTNGYQAETEILIDAYLKGYKFGKVSVRSIYSGHENHSKFSLLFDTWKIPGIMVKEFFKRKPFLLRTQEKKLRYRQAFINSVKKLS